MEQELFQHPVLREKHIRLCRLLPGQRDDPLICQIYSTAEYHSDNYEAISYVWSHSQSLAWITCNERPFGIDKNLDTILRYLRHPQDNRLIWVDSLCIDQTNATEKTGQVLLIGKIFCFARSVIVWLGHPKDGRRLPLHLIRRFCAFAGYATFTRRMLNIPPLESEEWLEIKSLLSSAWFWRSWTYQEILLAFTAKIMYGEDSIDWDFQWGFCSRLHSARRLRYLYGDIDEDPERTFYLNQDSGGFDGKNLNFSTFVYALSLCQDERIQDSPSSLENSSLWANNLLDYHELDEQQATQSGPRGLSEFEHLPGNLLSKLAGSSDGDATATMILSVVRARELKIKQGISRSFGMLALLKQRRSCRATDPRDKIFAILDVAAGGEAYKIRPDYSASVSEVYANAARRLIENRNDLDVLSEVEIPKSDMGLPSWVPDWAQVFSREMLAVGDCHRFGRASGTRIIDLYDPLKLGLEGAYIGTVMLLIRTDSLQNLSWRIGREYDPVIETLQGEPDKKRHSQTEDVRTLATIQREDEAGSYKDPNHQWSLFSFQHRDEVIARGHQDFQGVGPSTMKRSDEVFLLQGGRTPFVLRRQPVGSGRDNMGHFKLVGPCIVDDVGKRFQEKVECIALI